MLKRKWFIALAWGVLGGLAGAAIIVVANLLYDTRHHMGAWVHSVSWFLMIPSMLFASATGNWPNEYVLYSVLGFAGFAAASLAWQFRAKPNE
jgi:hypothetical protein